MKRKIILILTTTALLTTFLTATLNPLNTANATATIVQLKWTNPMAVYDVTVSKDGNYLAAVNDTGLYYFDADSKDPLWWYQPPTATLISVAISTDGDYVVAGDNNGYLHYFNQSAARTDSQTTPTWTSQSMYGAVEKGTLDMSANGNYTVVGGTGVTIWYYAGCTTRTGQDQVATWTHTAGVTDFLRIHISPNGKYVAGGGIRSGMQGFVVFYKDADTATGYNTPLWTATTQTPTPITDLALSDDGYAVAAIDMGPIPSTLYYWANATNLTDDPNATWINPGSFWCVDMSGNGDKVTAGGIYFTSLHFWANARMLQGTQTETWVKLETTNVYDVSISKDGNIIAAPAMDLPSTYSAYFLTSDGNIIGNFTLPEFANMVSMSDDGGTIAMAGPGYDSLYLFKALLDDTPPAINNVYQQPANDSVTPTDKVNVFANVTDDLSGVKQVILNYTTGNGTWFTQTMELYQIDIWNTTIPAFPYCTNITYIIIAEDNANNTITTEEVEQTYQYHVIPEFPSALIVPLFMVTTYYQPLHTEEGKKP